LRLGSVRTNRAAHDLLVARRGPDGPLSATGAADRVRRDERTDEASTQEGGAPAAVVGIDAEAMEDGTPGIAEARGDLHRVARLPPPVAARVPPPVAFTIDDHRRVPEDHVAGAGGELDVAVGGPATARPPLVVAVDARGRVVDRPQAVAAVAAGVIGEPA